MMDLQKDEDFEKAWQENRHIWESTKNLAKAMFYAGQAQAVPDGFVLVPKEQTKEMLDAGMGNFDFPLDNGRFNNHDLIFAYSAMIAAAQEQAND